MNSIIGLFGCRLKELRISSGITQEKFAEEIGINLRQLARIEAGESFIRAVTLEKICTVLNISPSVLFDFDFAEVNKNIHDTTEISKEYDLLKKKLLSIRSDKNKIEYMILAFDSLFSNKSLKKLKILIKGLELR